jgi:hypothetical protein
LSKIMTIPVKPWAPSDDRRAIVLSASMALEALPQVVMCDVVVTDLAMSGRDGRGD